RGFAAVSISGELTQNERSNALQSLRDGRARVCVATDVAARGIDLPDLGLVIHFDLPNDHETLLHRSGRTGRAGRKGVCVMLVPYTRRRKAERLIDMARVDVTWAGAPSADEIRLKDRERLMQDPIFAEEATDEDLSMARALLAERPAEEIANALVKFHRARLPAPEEIVDAGTDREPRQRKDKRERTEERTRGFKDRDRGSEGGFERSSEDMVWFRMSVGRRNNADPRWLLPIICRLGHVTKKEIGSIKIFDRETKFEIVKSQASKFASAVRKTNDEDMRIEPADAGPAKSGFSKSGPGKPRDAKPWSGPKGDGPKSHGPKERSAHPDRKGPPAGKGPKDFKKKDKKRSSEKRS
ncbi:MAG: helicase, partial [Microvirga sp.]|nr:helicase [Microvirga sp.]